MKIILLSLGIIVVLPAFAQVQSTDLPPVPVAPPQVGPRWGRWFGVNRMRRLYQRILGPQRFRPQAKCLPWLRPVYLNDQCLLWNSAKG